MKRMKGAQDKKNKTKWNSVHKSEHWRELDESPLIEKQNHHKEFNPIK